MHALAAKGDAYGEVLAELLSLKTVQGNSVFDLSKRNFDGKLMLFILMVLRNWYLLSVVWKMGGSPQNPKNRDDRVKPKHGVNNIRYIHSKIQA